MKHLTWAYHCTAHYTVWNSVNKVLPLQRSPSNTLVQLTVVRLSSLFIICKIKLLLKCCFLFDLKVQLREEHVVSISLGYLRRKIACIALFSRKKIKTLFREKSSTKDIFSAGH